MTPDDVMAKDIERMRAMLELVKEMAPPPPPPPPDTLAQLRDLVGFVKELVPPAPAAAAAPIVEVHDDDRDPLPGDAPPFLQVLDRIAGVVDKALDRREAATVAPAAAAADLTPRIEVPKWLAPFMGYLPQLVQLADAGQAPELCAQSIAANLRPEHIEALEPVLNHDGFPSSIVAMIPHLEQRQAWAVPFLYALRAAVFPVVEDVTDDESETG